MFQIKTFLGIAAAMINRLRVTSLVLTDFNVGSNVRVLLEAVAQEVDELYQQMVAALQAAIAQATYLSFGFQKLPAVSATAPLVVAITVQTVDVVIQAGTIFTPTSAGSISYTSTAPVTISAGDTNASVPVVCNVAGSAGNQPAGTTFGATPSPAGFVSCTSVSAITTGVDAETSEAQYVRFQAYIRSLARSTVAGVNYGASSVFLTDGFGNVTERVAAVDVYEPYNTDHGQPAWLYYIYIYNGVGTAPGASAALLTQVGNILYGYYDSDGNPIPGYIAAGTIGIVQAVTLAPQNITAALVVSADTVEADAIAAVEAAWADYLATLEPRAGYAVAKLVAIAMGVAGVTDISISLPAADVAGAVGVQVTFGVPTVTAAGGV
jgi:hypothetical protein